MHEDSSSYTMDFVSVWNAVFLLLFLWLGKLFWNVINHRLLVGKFPGPKGHSMIWGHAKLLGEVVPQLPSR
jgi:hypothetical protein